MFSSSFLLLCAFCVLGLPQDVHGIKAKPPTLPSIRCVRKETFNDELAHITAEERNAPTKSTELFIKAGIDKCIPFSFIKSAGPVLISAFCAAAIMYPMDLIRALQMANAGSGEKLGTLQLLDNFRKIHGFQGFFTQGLVPELARSTW